MILLPDTDAAFRRPLVFVTVGSDYHPFDRLISWVDSWLADGGSQRATCIMQYGTATRPRLARGEAFMAHDEVLTLMRAATVVVAQGGPMTLIEARRQGRMPLAVPRTRALGEVVDDHQHDFCRHMAEQGRACLATDEPSLRAALDRAMDDTALFSVDVVDEAGQVEAAVARFSDIADQLLREHQASAGRSRHSPRRFGLARH